MVGVEAEGAASMRASLDAGHPVVLDRVRTIADGIALKCPSQLTFDHVQAFVDDVVTVSEEEIGRALILLLERAKAVVEPSGAVGLAALLAGKVTGSGPVAAVLSGGNVDSLMLMRLVEHGLSAAGRYLRLRVVVPDRPGALASVTQAIAELGINVLAVEHHRAGVQVGIGEVEVLLTLETRNAMHREQVVEALRTHDYQVEALPAPDDLTCGAMVGVDGVHDLGGMSGFGPVVVEPDEPVFHAPWEARVFGLAGLVIMATGLGTPSFRHSIERMHPEHYLTSTYYEHWLTGLATVAVEAGVIDGDELDASAGGFPLSRPIARHPVPSHLAGRRPRRHRGSEWAARCGSATTTRPGTPAARTTCAIASARSYGSTRLTRSPRSRPTSGASRSSPPTASGSPWPSCGATTAAPVIRSPSTSTSATSRRCRDRHDPGTTTRNR